MSRQLLAARLAQHAPAVRAELALTTPPSVDRHNSAAFDAAFAARAVPTRRDYASELRFSDVSPRSAEVHLVNMSASSAEGSVPRA